MSPLFLNRSLPSGSVSIDAKAKLHEGNEIQRYVQEVGEVDLASVDWEDENI
jgi:hypothetical protein